MEKKLTTLSLSGLMIGPILGSGIVLLPPIAIQMLGDQAIIAWIIILLLGTVFAYVFTRMSLLAPSNEGVSVIIGDKLGDSYRELSSNYLMSAVCFGPVAVLFTASAFISGVFPVLSSYQTQVTFVLLALTAVILLMGITAIGRITLVLSSLTAVLLVVASSYNLYTQGAMRFPAALPDLGDLGLTLLLLFWAIIGWEVIGSYVEEVHDPQKTIMRAMKISVTAVTLIYLLSTFTLQNSLGFQMNSGQSNVNMNLILVPLFGSLSPGIMGVIATGLCYCTLIMILGAVTRQMAARAETGRLPSFFRQKATELSPKNALMALTLFHCLLILLVHSGMISIQWVVGVANAFFIGNALLGLTTGLKCVHGTFLKAMTAGLIAALGLLLFFSPYTGWVLLGAVTGVTLQRKICWSRMSG